MIRIISIIILCITVSSAKILNVPSDTFPDISSAIDSSASGDTVYVLPGEYIENLNFSGKQIFLTSHYYLSENNSDIENTIIDGNGTATVITFENGEDTTAILNGFTIRNGYNSGGGGGIACINGSSPKLTNLVITENVASNGAGIFCFNQSNPVIKNTIISENGSIYSGGGILLDRKCSINMEDVTINSNAANNDGGGIFLKDSSNIVYSSGKLFDNVGEWSGGGIFASLNSTLHLSELEILDNYTTGSGGGLNIINSHLNCYRITIAGNYAFDAAAISASNNSYIYALHATISSNQVFPSNGPVEFGGLWLDNSKLELANSILWGNSGIELNMVGSRTAIAYSNIENDSSQIAKDQNSKLFWLDANISESPLFMDSTFSDYRLSELSPCIDAGTHDQELAYNMSLDTLLIPVINYTGSNPDMGAYEFGDPTRILAGKYIPRNYQLHQNYPNPFNPQTTIGFTLSKRQYIRIDVFNVLGQPVDVLVNEIMNGGYHEVVFDGSGMASGIYYYRLSGGKFSIVKKMMLVR